MQCGKISALKDVMFKCIQIYDLNKTWNKITGCAMSERIGFHVGGTNEVSAITWGDKSILRNKH